jgi:predicted GIY-YIG superfamily endonuclease
MNTNMKQQNRYFCHSSRRITKTDTLGDHASQVKTVWTEEMGAMLIVIAHEKKLNECTKGKKRKILLLFALDTSNLTTMPKIWAAVTWYQIQFKLHQRYSSLAPTNTIGGFQVLPLVQVAVGL